MAIISMRFYNIRNFGIKLFTYTYIMKKKYFRQSRETAERINMGPRPYDTILFEDGHRLLFLDSIFVPLF